MKGNRTLLFVYLLCLVIVPCAQGQEFTPAEPGPTELTAAVEAQAGVLRLVRFSGTLQDALGQPRTGVVGVTFALYEEQEGSAPLWLETQNVELDAEGRYAVLLGAEHSEGLPLEFFSSGEARWLGVTVQGEAEQPRILLVSVPYALKAADAETLGGKPPSAFVLAEPSGAGTSGGEGDALTPTEGSAEAAVEPQVVSGTTGFLAKFTSSTDLGDSVAFESGGRIGIGTSAGLIARLQVKAPDNLFGLNLDSSSTSTGGFAAMQFRVNGSNNDRALLVRQPSSHASLPNALYISNIVGGTTVGALALRNNGNFEFMGGKVGIGTATPASPLQIVGGAGGGGSDSGSLILGPTGSTPHLRLGYNPAGYSWLQSHGGFPLRINPVGNNVLLNVSGGNVGIGTASPLALLHVFGSARFGGDGKRLIISPSADDVSVSFSEPSGGSALLKATFTHTNFFNRVNFSGNVGINTDSTFSPDSDTRLHIANEFTSPKVKIEGPLNTDSIIPILNFNEGLDGNFCGFQLKYLASSNQLRISSGCPTEVDNVAINRSSGRVGIGTTSPQDLLHVNGNVRLESVNDLSGSCILNCPSDARLKKDVQALAPVLGRLVRLEPVHFSWRTKEYPELRLGTARHTGLIAQQVQEALPELVGVRPDGFKTVKYHDLPILLLEAIRELNAENDSLERRLQVQQEQAALLIKAVREQQGQIQDLRDELESVKARLSRSDDLQLLALQSPK